MIKKVPITVYDEDGNETIKEAAYQSIVDEQTGMVEWQLLPGQELSVQKVHVNPTHRLVSVGGGTGQPIVLKGLKQYLFPDTDLYDPARREHLTAIVTMTDDGGSSGRLRNELNALPPGDIRNCLIGLSHDETLMTQLLRYRFEGDNGLSGHSLGNLILTALSEIHQNFLKAVKGVSSVLAIQGQILPSTIDHAVLKAELADGSIIHGETNINKTSQAIRRIMIEPDDVRPVDQVIETLEMADGIIIGPGSLYTSILPNLLIRDVAKAIQQSSAKTILVINLMTEPEETRGFSVSDYLRVIQDHIGFQVIDHALINRTPISDDLRLRYEEDGAEVTRYDLDEIHGLGVHPIEAELLSSDSRKVRHDPDKLARNILKLFQ